MQLNAETVLFIISGVMLLVGFFMVFFVLRKRARCTLPVVATIVSVSESNDLDDEGRRTNTRYYPVFEFTVNGTTVRKISDVSSRRYRKYRVGEQMEVKVNPNKPKQFIVSGKSGNLFGGITLMVMAVLLAVVVFLAAHGAFNGLVKLFG